MKSLAIFLFISLFTAINAQNFLNQNLSYTKFSVNSNTNTLRKPISIMPIDKGICYLTEYTMKVVYNCQYSCDVNIIGNNWTITMNTGCSGWNKFIACSVTCMHNGNIVDPQVFDPPTAFISFDNINNLLFILFVSVAIIIILVAIIPSDRKLGLREMHFADESRND